MKLEAKAEATAIVEKFQLQPHPEGGHYRRNFQSDDLVKSTDISKYHDEVRNAGSSIYYLLEGEDFSAWHRLKSDEIWNFYRGSLIRIHVIDKFGNYRTMILGDRLEHPDASFQIAISAGNYFAAEVLDKNSYCLVGCVVTPGFDFKDFELADRNELIKRFPQHHSVISRLTRVRENGVALRDGDVQIRAKL
jgi:predicted cupin superfamily sugar epimerase